ncbi:nicotinamide riboside transporter PnuC [Ningiella sp. W23]|uniref:nicotinamide riboside transporter PnuC n=1 Tax=Ningiella sp. W23 TaxID=3023715 RepID=UPI003756717D
MEAFFSIALEQWQQQSMAEICAVVFSIAYVWLAAEESILCWPAALISTILFAYVFWDVSLFFQMLLNMYYVMMAIIGFLHWRKAKEDFNALHMPLSLHLIVLGGGISLTLVTVFLAQSIALQWFAYDLLVLDAGITMFSLLTTYLTVKKYLQSWMYWSIINALSIYLFASNELYFTVILMLILILLALRGYINWSQDMLIHREYDTSNR